MDTRHASAAFFALLGLLLTGCATGSTGDDAAGPSRDAPPASTERPVPHTVSASDPASEGDGPRVGTTLVPTRPAPISGPRGSGHGLCFDLNSSLAAEAIAALGPDSNGGRWLPYRASSHPIADGCGLDWMLVNGDGFTDATYTSRVLLFAGGRFVGTVEPREYSYTSIAADTRDSVTVNYRWLTGDDPFCCPQGGPTSVTASLTGGAITRTGQFPPEPR